MRSAYTTPEVALSARRPDQLDADLLVVPIFEAATTGEDAWLDEACGGAISRARASSEFRGKLYDAFVTPLSAPGWRTRRVLLVGAGKAGDWTSERLRRLATTAGLYARQRHIERLAFVPGASGIAPETAAQVIAEGVCHANFDGGSYKTDDDKWGWLQHVELSLPESLKAQSAVERGRIVGELTNQARAFSNEPGNALTPRVFAERAQAIGSA